MLFAAGCEDGIEPLSPGSSAVDRVRAGDLTFTLQILNMQGEPQSEFKGGENLQFQFVIENKGDSIVRLPIYWNFPVVNQDFFALYRKTQESGGQARLGKSFDVGPNFRDIAPVSVPAMGASVYTMPWLTDKDSLYIMPIYIEQGILQEPSGLVRRYRASDDPLSALPVGEYFTGFTIRYSESDSVRLEASFTIDR